MIKEFKKFIMRGNVLDLAVGVIIGGAFGKIVSSLVNDIITPLIAILLGAISFEQIVWVVGTSEIKIGSFISSIIDFLITGFAIFVIVKIVTKLSVKPKKEIVAPIVTTKKCSFCFTEIPIEATRCPNCTSEL